ncbi:MAG: heavy metal-responsive transcriptional regulator [Gemmatimonadaceae bacterium]
MLIGEVAKQVGVRVQTLRYYELRGLLPDTKRRASGYREYDAGTVALVRFIRNAQELGFTLREISELIALRRQRSARRTDVRDLASRKIDEMDRRIRQLKSIKAELVTLIAECGGAGSQRPCPILTAIDGSPDVRGKTNRTSKSITGGTDDRQ